MNDTELISRLRLLSYRLADLAAWINSSRRDVQDVLEELQDRRLAATLEEEERNDGA